MEEDSMRDDLFPFYKSLGYEEGVIPSDVPPF